MTQPETLLFISSTFKGENMLKAVKAQGCYVLLLTEEKHREKPWPFDAIDEVFYTPDLARYRDVINTVSYLCRGRQIDRIIPLDEFEVEIAAMLREHLRLPGMGVTAARCFRDKLTMREVAQNADIPVPAFIGVKNYGDLRDYIETVTPPWVLKPRSEASAMGIRKIETQESLWRALDELGDNQSYYLLEKFLPGDVYHIDSLVYNGEVIFTSAQKYGAPPMSIYQGGGVFTTRVLPRDGDEATELRALNARVLNALGLFNGAAHTEFIRAHEDGAFYFLESAARVGGANIADLIHAASGIDLWYEWGQLEVMVMRDQSYELPQRKDDYAALLMTLAKQEHPDLTGYDAPEVVWRADKAYHAGLIVAAPDSERVTALLDDYTRRFAEDFTAVADPWGPQRTGNTG